MSDEAPTYLLVDGENIDATLGIQVLGHRPQPEERPRWERVRDFSAAVWGQPVRPLFFLNATTGQLKRKLPDLVDWLRKSNDVPTGTILSTGTGIIQPLGSGLEPGDTVAISSPQLGTLSNPVAFV